jgi:hypothetical protein
MTAHLMRLCPGLELRVLRDFQNCFTLEILNLQFPGYLVISFSFSFFFFGEMGLNLGLHACKTGALPLEPHLQSILLWYFFWR